MLPVYIKTYNEGKLKEKIGQLNKILTWCILCPRRCRVNRLKVEKGYCGAARQARVSSFFPHFGEESPLVGRNGSGTIFFSHCNLKCVFCQNYEISHLAQGRETTPDELTQIMLRLQNMSCHNINFVTPTHYVPQILEALQPAIEAGLNIPLVYNCGGYESEEVIDILDGIIDIYMPDVKFSSSEVAKKFSNASDYFSNLKIILKKMHRQVGDLQMVKGIAQKGLLIRHLVMPGGLAGTEEIMKFIAGEISVNSYINIMAQYRPSGEAYRYPKISRPITWQEYLKAKQIALGFGLKRFDK